MNYRAACPHCASVFRLGDDQLAAAAGWVQCGVCGGAFDARLSLRNEDGSMLPLASEPDTASPSAFDAAPVPVEPEEHGQVTPESRAAPSSDETATPEADETAPEDRPRGIHERETALDLPSIILIDPNLPTYDDPGPLPVIRAETREPGPQPALPEAAAAVAPSPAAPSPAARIEYAEPRSAPARSPAGRRRPYPWVWAGASLLLLTVLIAQSAYFLRDTLAQRVPQARPVLEQACALLGCALSLPGHLDQLRIVGSDLANETDGRLILTLTLGNRAAYAQAWPMLTLTLTNPAGRPVARRSFAPSEYLGDPARIAAGMPPQSEQALRLPLTVRDLTPAGFDLRLGY